MTKATGDRRAKSPTIRSYFWTDAELRKTGAVTKAIGHIRSCLDVYEKGYRAFLSLEYARCVHLARFLAASPGQWQDFCGDDEAALASLNRNADEASLRLVISSVFDADTRTARQRCSRIFLALSKLGPDIEVDEIPQKIQVLGGITEMAKPIIKAGGVPPKPERPRNAAGVSPDYDSDNRRDQGGGQTSYDDGGGADDDTMDDVDRCLTLLAPVRGETAKLTECEGKRVRLICKVGKFDEDISFIKILKVTLLQNK
jgi:hypothetical protein